MQPDERALLLSLRPRFAELVLAGRKTVELRRVRPNVAPGAIVLIYATAPTSALVGTASVLTIHVDDRERTWQQHGARTGVTRAEYDEYFHGAAEAVAISLTGARRIPRPISLPQLRHGRSWFRPPQSFRYLSADQAASFGVL